MIGGVLRTIPVSKRNGSEGPGTEAVVAAVGGGVGRGWTPPTSVVGVVGAGAGGSEEMNAIFRSGGCG